MCIQQDGNYMELLLAYIEPKKSRYVDFINKQLGDLGMIGSSKKAAGKSWAPHLQMIYLSVIVRNRRFWLPDMLNRHPKLVSYSKRHTQDTPKLSNCNITVGIDDKILSRCHGILAMLHQICWENGGWSFHRISLHLGKTGWGMVQFYFDLILWQSNWNPIWFSYKCTGFLHTFPINTVDFLGSQARSPGVKKSSNPAIHYHHH